MFKHRFTARVDTRVGVYARASDTDQTFQCFVFFPFSSYAAMKSGGTQLKLIMTFQNYGQALFKPMK